jgi:competence protein ComFC
LQSIVKRAKELLTRLKTSQPVCLNCFCDLIDGLEFLDLFRKEDILCGYCRQQFKLCRESFRVLGENVYAYYEYDSFFEKLIYQVKENKDETLAPVFLHPYGRDFKKRCFSKTLVLVPSSRKKFESRGFDALRCMIQVVDMEMICPFEKDDIKQSHRNIVQRSKIKNHIRLIHPEWIIGKDIVLIDDVCTTGYSLKACIDLLKPLVKSIIVIVLAMHPDHTKI